MCKLSETKNLGLSLIYYKKQIDKKNDGTTWFCQWQQRGRARTVLWDVQCANQQSSIVASKEGASLPSQRSPPISEEPAAREISLMASV